MNDIFFNARPTMGLRAFLLVMPVLFMACSGGNDNGPAGTPIDLACTQDQIQSLPIEPISTDESGALVFMREEEKLARDVYEYLGNRWGLKIFSNIAASEQTHMDSVALLLERYDIADPAAGTNRGQFMNGDLQQLYNELTSQGNASLVAALIVGATIEDLDIYDLQQQLDSVVDNQDIQFVWENLQKGSRNHLRSFVGQLERQGGEYSPQFLDQDSYDAILESPKETGACVGS